MLPLRKPFDIVSFLGLYIYKIILLFSLFVKENKFPAMKYEKNKN